MAKKASNKNQTLLKKLNVLLQSPKNKLVATVLVFAIVGGGIMVYRSFAAVGTNGPANVANNKLVMSDNVQGFKTKQVIVEDQVLRSGAKSPESVMQAGRGKSVYFRDVPYNGTPRNGNYRFCALMRSTAGEPEVYMTTGITGEASDIKKLNTIYVTHCTGWKPIKPSTRADSYVLNAIEATPVNIAEMWYDLTFAPPPAGDGKNQ